MICPVCGKEHDRRKYCSVKCRNKRNNTVNAEYQKEYWRSHKKEMGEHQKKFRESHKEQELLRQKEWRENNKEYESSRKKEYRKIQKEKYGIPDQFGRKTQKLLRGIIEEILGYPIEEEVYFNWCRNPETNYMMPIDLFVPQLNLIVEYNGQQHYSPLSFDTLKNTDHFKVMTNFIKRKRLDKLKQGLILENGYNFLIVPYWENLSITNIRTMLSERVINLERFKHGTDTT